MSLKDTYHPGRSKMKFISQYRPGKWDKLDAEKE